MALAAGLSATALYFAQPLLHRLSLEFGMSAAQSSWLVTGAQAGYAVGLLFLVPLGDILRRRRFAVTLLLLTATLLVVATVSVDGSMLFAATVAASIAAVGAQVLVPMAAGLAPEGRSGRAVGIVMSGVLSGGMLGRAGSGVLADIAGWRSGYWVAAGVLVVTALALYRRLPADVDPSAPFTVGRYLRLLRSLITPLQQLAVFRRRTLVAALTMSAFTIQLSVVTLRLSAAPFGWSTTAIGIFSLLALVGIALMPLTGRLADAGRTRIVISVGLVVEFGAWILMLVAGSTILGLSIGVVGLIVGQQAVIVASQALVYTLQPEARSRINAIFMASCFAAGAAGSALAAGAWSVAGWTGACVLAAALAFLALTTELLTRGRSPRLSRPTERKVLS